MAVEIGAAGGTIQLWVSDGAGARTWYERVFGRSPDFRPADNDTFCESGASDRASGSFRSWSGNRPGRQRARLRFGVEDIQQAHSIGMVKDRG